MPITAYAPGKVILSGEYAMLFGHPGLAFPWTKGVTVTYESAEQGALEIVWNGDGNTEMCLSYIQRIVRLINPNLSGMLTASSEIPIGKGMGSSTAIVIAIARAILGNGCKSQALALEDQVNPGHSGMDFAVIWEGKPTVFTRGKESHTFHVQTDLLQGMHLIDTGMPEQATPELVAWVKERSRELTPVLERIGHCTKNILAGEPVATVVRDHHRAQMELGVVPEAVQRCIADIEHSGGSAKVIGAGGRSGGAGIVLSLGIAEHQLQGILRRYNFSFLI